MPKLKLLILDAGREDVEPDGRQLHTYIDVKSIIVGCGSPHLSNTGNSPDGESNFELWRARALLLFRMMEFTDTGREPRRDDWPGVFDACAKHDSENALYQLMRWQSARLDTKKRRGQFEAAVAFPRNVLRISDQVTEAGNHADAKHLRPSPNSVTICMLPRS
jgi:hypothetical protein